MADPDGPAPRDSGSGSFAPRTSILRNLASSWAVTVAGVVYVLFVTPIVVRTLGQEEYGVWSFLNGLLGYSNLLYLGVGSALVKNVATLSVTGDHAAINRLASVAISIFSVLGCVVLISAVGLSPWVPQLFGASLPDETARSASFACAVLGVQVLCVFVTSAYMGILLGHDRFDLANLAQIATTVIRLVFVVTAVRGEQPLVRLAVFMTLASAIELFVVRRMAHAVSRSLQMTLTLPLREDLRMLYSFGIPAFFITFAVRLISYTDTTVIGVLLGASSVGLYTLPLQLTEFTRLTVGAYSGVLIARLARLHAEGNVEELRRIYLQSARVTSLMAAFALSHVVLLGVPFLELWAGPGFGEPVRWVLVWLSLATFMSAMSTVVLLPFFHGMQILGTPMRVLLIEAAINLALSLLLVRRFGLAGVAMATFLPALGTYVWLPRLMSRKLSLPPRAHFSNTLQPATWVILTVAAAHVMTSAWIPTTSFVGCALRVMASAPGAAVAVLATLSTEDRQQVALRLRRVLTKS